MKRKTSYESENESKGKGTTNKDQEGQLKDEVEEGRWHRTTRLINVGDDARNLMK